MENLIKALVKFQGKVKPVKKDSENPHFKSDYASLEAFIISCQALLSECGLAFVAIPSADGNAVTITGRVCHESGEVMEGILKLTARDGSPQSIGSALSYGRRYLFSSMLNVPTIGEDDDGNHAQPEKPTPVERQKPAKAQQMSPREFILDCLRKGVITAEWLDAETDGREIGELSLDVAKRIANECVAIKAGKK
jgi:hypothetical protein